MSQNFCACAPPITPEIAATMAEPAAWAAGISGIAVCILAVWSATSYRTHPAQSRLSTTALVRLAGARMALWLVACSAAAMCVSLTVSAGFMAGRWWPVMVSAESWRIAGIVGALTVVVTGVTCSYRLASHSGRPAQVGTGADTQAHLNDAGSW